MNKEEVIEQARALRRDDELEESQALLLDLLDVHPKDPLVLYEVGGAYDVLGEEKNAIPFYRKAISAGLQGDDLQECLICLGSSYRNIGQFTEAVEALEDARKRFPDNNAMKTFLALAYYSDAQEDRAVQLLLELLLATTSDKQILAYEAALDYYKDNLDEIWDE